jgi:hypothetical protein
LKNVSGVSVHAAADALTNAPTSELHPFEHKCRMLECLEAYSTYEVLNSSANSLTLGHYFNGAAGGMTAERQPGLQLFSEPDDQLGYDGKSISHEIITKVFVDFTTRTRQKESALYLKSLSGKYYKTKWHAHRLTHCFFFNNMRFSSQHLQGTKQGDADEQTWAKDKGDQGRNTHGAE